MRGARRTTYTKCPECGYDVRGIPRPLCPECGFNLTRPSFYRHTGQMPWWTALFDTPGIMGAMFLNFGLAMLTGAAIFRGRPQGWFTFPLASLGRYEVSAASLTILALLVSLSLFSAMHDRIDKDSWVPQILWAVVIYGLTLLHLLGVVTLYF